MDMFPKPLGPGDLENPAHNYTAIKPTTPNPIPVPSGMPFKLPIPLDDPGDGSVIPSDDGTGSGDDGSSSGDTNSGGSNSSSGASADGPLGHDFSFDETQNDNPHSCVGGKGMPLETMYDFFFAGITDDMFMELTKEDTDEIVDEILMSALPHFEFPHVNIFDIDWGHRCWNIYLSAEEMMIIRQYMIVEWIGYQLASIEVTRQKYSGSDFKFTSQASHMARLIELQKQYTNRGFHLQRLYSRRTVDSNGQIVPTMSTIMP